MEFEGLFRQMHSTLYVVSSIFILVTILYLVTRKYFGSEIIEGGITVKTYLNKLYFVVCFVLILFVVLQVANIFSTNRIPRSIEDKSDVYKQAEVNKE